MNISEPFIQRPIATSLLMAGVLLMGALVQNNVNAPKGSFDGKHQSYSINANDQIFSAAEFRDVIIAYKKGSPVRLRDIGDVIDNVENVRMAGWVDGKPAVILDIQRQPGANIIETANRVKALLPMLRSAIPPSVTISILTDRTETIRASVADVQFTLVQAVLLVVMVIFVFLRKFWATVIPSVALPLTIVGRLFREFAISISAAVVVSAIVSLTLTPMMCARLLKAEDKSKHGRWYLATDRMFHGLLGAYDRSLQWVLRHQAFTLIVAIVTMVATVWLYIIVPKGLLPQQDTGLIIGVTDSAQSISFKSMVERQRAVAEIVRQDPDVVSVASFVGAGTVNATVNSGRLYLNLKPRDCRQASATAIIDRLRAATESVEGISLFMQAAQDVQIDSRVSRRNINTRCKTRTWSNSPHGRQNSWPLCATSQCWPMSPRTSNPAASR